MKIDTKMEYKHYLWDFMLYYGSDLAILISQKYFFGISLKKEDILLFVNI